MRFAPVLSAVACVAVLASCESAEKRETRLIQDKAAANLHALSCRPRPADAECAGADEKAEAARSALVAFYQSR